VAVNVWQVGRAEVEQALREGAEGMLDQARGALASAEASVDISVESAFTLLYDAGRLAMAAVLVNQGLKTRGEGAHATVIDLVLAQTEPPKQEAFRAMRWMRPLRNDTQYPNPDRPRAARDDYDDAHEHVPEIIDRATKLVAVMPPF